MHLFQFCLIQKFYINVCTEKWLQNALVLLKIFKTDFLNIMNITLLKLQVRHASTVGVAFKRLCHADPIRPE